MSLQRGQFQFSASADECDYAVPHQVAELAICAGDFGTVGKLANFRGGDRAPNSYFDRMPPREQAALAHHLVSPAD